MQKETAVLAKKTFLNKMFYCAIEGNIGVGKSTFLREVIHRLKLNVIAEPVDAWQHVGADGNVLAQFYKDPYRWSYAFQSYALLTRTVQQQAEKVDGATLCITERSIYSDRYCFAQNCFEQGFMSVFEWNIYQELFSWLVGVDSARPSGFIYLRADPQVCYERLRMRNRDEERGITLSYLKSLHEQHEEWLVARKGVDKDMPVLVIDCNRDFEHHEDEMQKIMTLVKEFCDQKLMQTV